MRSVAFDWMTAVETQRIVDIFAAANAEMRFVGGCVRDAILDRPSSDIDIATDALPKRVQEILRNANIKTIPTGIDHGTVTAIIDGRPFEITTYRHDVKTDGRRAVVAFSTDWREDAARRDFTINALSITPDGVLYDPFGGEADLLAGRIRFVGEARRRVREDILRILRWFRFHAHFGRHPPDKEALAACRGFAYQIPNLSGERIRYELMRLLDAPHPISSLKLMMETDVIDAILGRGRRLALITSLCEIEHTTEIPGDSFLRLAGLIGTYSTVDPIADRLRLATKERRRLNAALADTPTLDPGATVKQRRCALYGLDTNTALDRIMLAWAANPGEKRWGNWLETHRTFERPIFPLTGHDVTWLKATPAVGQVLKSAETWWIEKDFAPDRAACLRYLKDLRTN